MRFTRLHLDNRIVSSKGLKGIQFDRLSNVVALVGRNGAGKSRILNSIKEHGVKSLMYRDMTSGNSIKHIPESANGILRGYDIAKDVIIALEDVKELERLQTETSDAETLWKYGEQISAKHDYMNGVFNSAVPKLYTAFQRYQQNDLKDIHGFMEPYVQKIELGDVKGLTKALDNSSESSFQSLLSSVSYQKQSEFQVIKTNALTYLGSLPNNLVKDYMYSKVFGTDFHEADSYKKYVVLKKFFKIFLKKELDWKMLNENSTSGMKNAGLTAEGQWLMSGRKFEYDELSDGEKTLFAYCLLFFLIEFNRRIRITESIILIDEPELHLHPKMEVDLVNAIREVIGEKGQLWIATHSLNILSNLAPEEIFLVKDGTVYPPGKTPPEETFEELMDVEESAERLRLFLNDVKGWAYTGFIDQCYQNPDVIESAKEDDPQVEVFKLAVKSGGIAILDCGAGKGRLFKAMKQTNGGELLKKINYAALEIVPEYQRSLYELGVPIVYKSYSELQPESIDQVIICNVLHEIPIEEWEASLNQLYNALKPKGQFIIVEDSLLPKGEFIEGAGFLILSPEELKTLFTLKELPSLIRAQSPKYRERIVSSPES